MADRIATSTDPSHRMFSAGMLRTVKVELQEHADARYGGDAMRHVASHRREGRVRTSYNGEAIVPVSDVLDLGERLWDHYFSRTADWPSPGGDSPVTTVTVSVRQGKRRVLFPDEVDLDALTPKARALAEAIHDTGHRAIAVLCDTGRLKGDNPNFRVINGHGPETDTKAVEPELRLITDWATAPVGSLNTAEEWLEGTPGQFRIRPGRSPAVSRASVAVVEWRLPMIRVLLMGVGVPSGRSRTRPSS
ncbi:hypothetical protein ACH4VR_29360 [Streptomyces sp. NPDC020883]|uniref:hypothetical protein n=1 Tax=Streptomyces sp. NPDC020883 TaxID=3365099 RepID=UPI003793F6AB